MSYKAPYVWLVSSAAALGGLLFGYDWVAIGARSPFIKSISCSRPKRKSGGRIAVRS
jgi:hypothetical protein